MTVYHCWHSHGSRNLKCNCCVTGSESGWRGWVPISNARTAGKNRASGTLHLPEMQGGGAPQRSEGSICLGRPCHAATAHGMRLWVPTAHSGPHEKARWAPVCLPTTDVQAHCGASAARPGRWLGAKLSGAIKKCTDSRS